MPESESRPATVPPKVQPFSLRKDLALGERVSVQCTVNGGDTPLLVTWTKDGVAAEQIPGTEVRQLDQYTNILSITRLAALHTGNYTCTAANDAATVTHTAPLRVNGNYGVFLFLTLMPRGFMSPFSLPFPPASAPCTPPAPPSPHSPSHRNTI